MDPLTIALIAAGLLFASRGKGAGESDPPPEDGLAAVVGLAEELGGAVIHAVKEIGNEERSIVASWRSVSPGSAPMGTHPAGPRQWTAWLRFQSLGDFVAATFHRWDDGTARVAVGGASLNTLAAAARWCGMVALGSGRWPWDIPTALADIQAPSNGWSVPDYGPEVWGDSAFRAGIAVWRESVTGRGKLQSESTNTPHFERSSLRSRREDYGFTVDHPEQAVARLRDGTHSGHVIARSAQSVESLCASWIAGPKTARAFRMPPRAVWHGVKASGLYPSTDWQLGPLAFLPGETVPAIIVGVQTVAGVSL